MVSYCLNRTEEGTLRGAAVSWVRALLTVIQCQTSQRWIGRGAKAAKWGINVSRRVTQGATGGLRWGTVLPMATCT